MEIPNSYQQPPMSVIRCTSKKDHITRIEHVVPSQGEHFYICALLLNTPCRSFDDLRTVDGTVFDTFQEAAKHCGIFADQSEDIFTLHKAVSSLYTP
jgi:hypothetical protein